MTRTARATKPPPEPVDDDDASDLMSASLGDSVMETVFRRRALAEIGAADTSVLLALASAVSRMRA